MSDKIKLNNRGWFTEEGSENDVIVYSRISLSRNIKETVFPANMDRETEEKFYREIRAAVDNLDKGSFFHFSKLDYDERRLLSERHYIKGGASFERDPAVYITDDEKYLIVFNQDDHVMIKSFRAGLDLRKAYNNCNLADNLLEEKLSYAWSSKFGYLTSDLTAAGTGLKSSVMLFLPAITRTGKIDKVMKDVMQSGLSVTGFVGDGDNSSGDQYIIENQFSIGESEEEIINRIESISVMITDYEREVRDFLFKKEGAALEDEVMRAYGILKYCRILTINEAIKNLSLLKLGKYLNIINEGYITYCNINCLLIEIQKAHLNMALSGNDEADMKRAELVQTRLFKGKGKCLKD